MKPETFDLVPAPGRSVPLEDGKPWPATIVNDDDGNETTELMTAIVPNTRYYRRRLRDGDLVTPEERAKLLRDLDKAKPKPAPSKTEAETKKGK